MGFENPVAAFRLSIDGVDLGDKIRPRLVSLTLAEKRGADADQLDLVLSDADGALAIPREGAVLTLAIGWERGSGVVVGLVEKGQFKVDEVSHGGSPDQLTIRARAADFTGAARIRRLGHHNGKTLGEIVKTLAARSGLTASIDGALAGITVPVLDQGRMSDLAMIRRLGKTYDAVATVKAGRLVFSPIGKGASPSGRALPAVTIARGDGDGHDWKRAGRERYAGVTAEWHDTSSATRKAETAGSADGARKLRKTFGSSAEARAAAAAEHKRQQRAASTMSLNLALGRPDIYPEQRATLTGWKAEIDGTRWLIVDATHTLGDGGLTTSLNLETAI